MLLDKLRYKGRPDESRGETDHPLDEKKSLQCCVAMGMGWIEKLKPRVFQSVPNTFNK
jgi:hypothetical protein